MIKLQQTVAEAAIGSSARDEQERMLAAGSATFHGRLRATPLPGWPQRILHIVAVVAGWALFLWGWHEVLGQPWDTHALQWLIVGSLVVLPAVSAAWILHNLGIHRRKGPRTGVRKVDESYLHDWNGRSIHADFATLRNARIVVIDLHGQCKVYEATPGDTAQLIDVQPFLRTAGDSAANGDPTQSAVAA